MTKIKTVIMEGLAYEELGPYCELCGAHMGNYYSDDAEWEKKFLNPHNYESYGKNKCPHCGMEYQYEEGNMMVLTKKDLAAIRKVRGVQKWQKGKDEE